MIRSLFLAIALMCFANTAEAQYRKAAPKPQPKAVVVQRPVYVAPRPVYIAPIVNPQLRDYQWFLREQQRLNYLYQLESQRQMYQYQLDLQRRMLYGY